MQIRTLRPRFLPLLLLAPFAALAAPPASAPPRVERGNLLLEGIPEIPTSLSDRLMQYQNVRSATVSDWLPGDTGIVIATRFGETSQLHVVRQPGGARTQITFFREPVVGAAVHPRRNELLFTMSRGGDEFDQIHRFNLDDGRWEKLTEGRFIHRAVQWNRKGDSFAFLSNRRNGTDWDIYVADAARPHEPRLVASPGGFWSPSGFSPDDTRLLLRRTVSANESHLHVLDLASGRLAPVNPSSARTDYGGAAWSADGQGLWLVCDEGSEFKRLFFHDIASGGKELVTPDIAWDIEGLAITEDRSRLAFAVNAAGRSELHLLDAATRKTHRVAGLPVGIIGSIDFDHAGRRLAISLSTAQSPSDVFVLDLATERLERWTASEVGGLDTARFVSPAPVRWPTFDNEAPGKRREITGFLYRPSGDARVPVVVDIHGGPEGQSRPGFSSWIQFLVGELGVAVIQPNVRGSEGYGKGFLELDNGFRREDSVRDIGALLDWIAQQPGLDAGRVAVYGGSYGGYMVNACLTHYNDRLRGGVCVVGISNFLSFLANTESYRRDLRRVEYGDERDPAMHAFLEKISPLNNVARISRPVFFIHGQNDPRVPVGEAEQMARAVRANGAEVWMLVAKDEGHGFAKKSNRDFQQAATALFYQRILGLGPAAN